MNKDRCYRSSEYLRALFIVSLYKCCLCFDCQWDALWSLKTVENSRLQLSPEPELRNWTPTTSSLLTSIGVLRASVWHVALWMGESQMYEGEGEKGGRERDCSVVVYVSLRGCVGRSAPSRHCCCCEKRQNKGLPTLWNPYTFAGSAVLWSHPDGMLLKLTILRSTAGVNWPGTQSVTEARRKLNRKLRHRPKSFSFLVLLSWVHPPPFSGKWPLLIRFQSFLWRFGTDITVAYLLKGLLWILTVGRLHWSQRQEWTSRLLQRLPLWSRWGWTRLSKHEIHGTLSVKAPSGARD